MKTVAISDHSHEAVKKLSKSQKVSIGEYLDGTILFLKRTGINPFISEEQSPHKILKGMDKRIEQVLSYVCDHKTENLNSLLERLILLSNELDQTKTQLPTLEHIKRIVDKMNELLTTIKKQHTQEKESISQNQDHLNNSHVESYNKVIEAINALAERQSQVEKAIEGKLSKKIF